MQLEGQRNEASSITSDKQFDVNGYSDRLEERYKEHLASSEAAADSQKKKFQQVINLFL